MLLIDAEGEKRGVVPKLRMVGDAKAIVVDGNKAAIAALNWAISFATMSFGVPAGATCRCDASTRADRPSG